jgi:hypothetical protein
VIKNFLSKRKDKLVSELEDRIAELEASEAHALKERHLYCKLVHDILAVKDTSGIADDGGYYVNVDGKQKIRKLIRDRLNYPQERTNILVYSGPTLSEDHKEALTNKFPDHTVYEGIEQVAVLHPWNLRIIFVDEWDLRNDKEQIIEWSSWAESRGAILSSWFPQIFSPRRGH